MRGRSLFPNTPGTGRFKRETPEWHHRLVEQGQGNTYDSPSEVTYDDTDWTYEGTRVTP